jgi:hypothetical protein
MTAELCFLRLIVKEFAHPPSAFLIDHGRSLFQIGLHFSFNVIDLETDVMDPLTFGFQQI